MRLTFLGTGGVWAAPVHGCNCKACAAARRDPARARAPASALLEAGGKRLLIDAGRADLNDRFPPGSLDGVLLTHFHADHVLGLTLMRWSLAEPLPVWCPHDPKGFDDLRKHPGRLHFVEVDDGETFDLEALRITPLALNHSRPTLGWLVEAEGFRIAYLSDTRGLPGTTADRIGTGADIVVLDCAYPAGVEGPRNHNDISEAEAILDRLSPLTARLTHINHDLDATHPEDPRFAVDGCIVDLTLVPRIETHQSSRSP